MRPEPAQRPNLDDPRPAPPAEVEEAWFDAPPPSSARHSSAPPPPVVKIGEFLGDPLADAWLR